MPRPRPPDELSSRALWVLTRRRGGVARPAEPAWVSPPAGAEHYVPTRAELEGTAVGGRPRGPVRPRLVALPAALRGARLSTTRTALAAVLAAVVLAGGVFGLRVALAERSATVTPVAGAATSAVSPAAVPSGGATGGDPVASATDGLVVHVVGEVRHPGIVRLAPGARVVDAVAAAGGAGPRADLSAVNLARPVVDGEQIRVPRPGEVVAQSGAGTPGAPGTLVPLNTAGLAALDALPGVGPVLAQRIIDWRTEHGRFTSVDELSEVSGIGEKLLAQLRPKVTL